MAKAKTAAKLKYKPDSLIGAAAAEDDEGYLASCFVDTGNLATLMDSESCKRIVVGRTGAGKSALLRMLAEAGEHVIEIDPQHLAIKHISNSAVIKYFSDRGVSLDTFYQSLWQHTFCIELIKYAYDVSNKGTFAKFIGRIGQSFAFDKRRRAAWEYLESWGDEEFWSDTHTRAVRMTSKIEDQLKASVGLELPALAANLGASRRSTEELSEEIVNHAQRVVDAVKLKQLHEVMDLLADHVFSNPKECHYIIIDDLDRHWVDNKIRYRLIRALVESVKRFKRLRNVKVIISLRRDLIDKVIEETRDAGFQEEKYEDLYLQLRWTEEDLRRILAQRWRAMFERRYELRNVDFESMFPAKIGVDNSFKYILTRTQKRPRDVIQFVNKILEAAAGRAEITKKMIMEAEDKYSEQRLKAVYDEWLESLPALRRCTSILAGPKHRFWLKDLDFGKVQDCLLEAATFSNVESDSLARAAKRCIDDDNIGTLQCTVPFLRELFSTFHKIGLVGIKLDSQSAVRWCEDAVGFVPPAAIDLNTFAEIHPMYLRAFGVSHFFGANDGVRGQLTPGERDEVVQEGEGRPPAVAA